MPGGRDPDGSVELLAIYGGDPKAYVRHAKHYFEVTLPLAAVKRIYAQEPLDEELVEELNPEASLDDLEEDLETIGWPTG